MTSNGNISATGGDILCPKAEKQIQKASSCDTELRTIGKIAFTDQLNELAISISGRVTRKLGRRGRNSSRAWTFLRTRNFDLKKVNGTVSNIKVLVKPSLCTAKPAYFYQIRSEPRRRGPKCSGSIQFSSKAFPDA